MSIQAAVINHICTGHVLPSPQTLSHTNTCTDLVIALCNRGGFCMCSFKASHVRVDNLRSDAVLITIEKATQLPICGHVLDYICSILHFVEFTFCFLYYSPVQKIRLLKLCYILLFFQSLKHAHKMRAYTTIVGWHSIWLHYVYSICLQHLALHEQGLCREPVGQCLQWRGLVWPKQILKEVLQQIQPQQNSMNSIV